MTLCLLAPTAWCTTSAQDAGLLSLPGDVRPDTVYGRIGEWFAVRDLGGTTTPFESLRGRVLFVNFWATWCGPCIEEMPTIIDLQKNMSDDDVTFLLISIDDDERLVRRFVRKHEVPIPVYLRDWQSGESTFAAGIVPATFIVSRDGEIAYQHHGAANWNNETIHGFLRSLSLQ